MTQKFLIPALALVILAISCSKSDKTAANPPLYSSANIQALFGHWEVVHTSFTVLNTGSQKPVSTGSSVATATWDFRGNGRLYTGTSSESFSYKILDNNRLVLSTNSTSDTLYIESTAANSINLSNSKIMPNGNTTVQRIDLVQQ